MLFLKFLGTIILEKKFNRLVITGGSGTLGRRFGAETVRLSLRLEDSLAQMKAHLQEKDVRGATLIHLAAMTSVTDCESDPHRAFELNAHATVRLFQAAIEAGVSKFIYVSTAHVFAEPTGKNLITENSPVEPKTIYGKSKLLGEVFLQSHPQKSQITFTVARVFSVVAPDMPEHFLMPALINRAKNQDYSPIPGFYNTRDFVSADEVVRCLEQWAQVEVSPPCVLICSGQGKTVGELAAEVFKDHGADPKLLIGAPPRPTDVPWIVGSPTRIPSK